MNEEFPVSASHKLALITSLPFVHTARRYYRLDGLVSSLDWSRRRGNALVLVCREEGQTVLSRGSKSRNKVSVGEPAEGSLTKSVSLLVGRHGKRTRQSDKRKGSSPRAPRLGRGEVESAPTRRPSRKGGRRLGCRSRTGSVTSNTDELDRRLRALWKVSRTPYCLASSVIGPTL